MRRFVGRLAALTVAVGLLAGCIGSDDAASQASGSESPTVTGTITVFAAASLQDAFTDVGRTFERRHPGSKVVLNFGPSSGLAQQIGQGAPADVFASASTKTMEQVVKERDAIGRREFATNTMEIVVPPDNPAGITS